jgi:4-hydroxybenzoate polyprenyltransferase
MLRAIAESGRISNLPTVWSNVLVGGALAGWSGAPGPMALAIGGPSLLYLGGMFLNDAFDAEWDRAHRKDRPVAGGRLPRRAAYALAWGCLIGGITLAGLGRDPPTSLAVALTLSACIVLYNLLHKRFRGSVVLMALCRALVYPLAASMLGGGWAEPVWPASVAIAGTTTLLTLAARREEDRGGRTGAALACSVPAPYLVAIWAYGLPAIGWVIAVVGLLLVWAAKGAADAVRGRVRNAVLAWLAGLCLGDALVLTLLERLDLAGLAVMFWIVTVLAHRRITGT